MSEWLECTLGEVASVIGGGTPSTKEPTYWNGDVLWLTPGDLTKRQGRVISTTERTISAAGLANSSATLLPKDAVLLTSRATVGVVGLAGRPMATNQGFQSLVAHQGLSPRFLMCWVQANRGEFQDRASGSTFPEISGRKVRAIPIKIPPLVEQHRIVAVMSAVDAQIVALEVEVKAAGAVVSKLLSAVMEELVTSVPFGSLATTRSGPSWAASDESKTPVASATRVVKITNTKSDGTLDMSDGTYVSSLPKATALLDEDSLIIIRTNGNRGRIGNVYRAVPQVYGCAVSAFQFISRVQVKVDREFLYWALREPSMQKRMSDAASGSTGLGNLAVRWLNTVEIPWTAEADERGRIVATMDAAEATANAGAAELAALRVVRAALLSALLSQDISIDDAVDRFLIVA